MTADLCPERAVPAVSAQRIVSVIQHRHVGRIKGSESWKTDGRYRELAADLCPQRAIPSVSAESVVGAVQHRHVGRIKSSESGDIDARYCKLTADLCPERAVPAVSAQRIVSVIQHRHVGRIKGSESWKTDGRYRELAADLCPQRGKNSWMSKPKLHDAGCLHICLRFFEEVKGLIFVGEADGDVVRLQLIPARADRRPAQYMVAVVAAGNCECALNRRILRRAVVHERAGNAISH